MTFLTVYDGVRGMQFIHKAVESCKNGSSLGKDGRREGARQTWGAEEGLS